ncbi:MAG: DUF2249 domain-containing protein [Pseudomonadota bacterium]
MTREILVDARDLEAPEPLERALAALGGMGEGERLRLLVPREPLPLYALLEQMGYRHQARMLPDGACEVLIHRA